MSPGFGAVGFQVMLNGPYSQRRGMKHVQF